MSQERQGERAKERWGEKTERARDWGKRRDVEEEEIIRKERWKERVAMEPE